LLQLKNITKDYVIGTNTVKALKGIDLKFRDNEFVSILGPSGCGKTTMLNLLGGLDIYTTGDLIINGKSTKDFSDRDWDTYRNRRVGFVFQNYNLISHQTVLSNVELALTLSGVSKPERRKRAIEVLEKVGLADQLNKKPNQMSGGQMQRVAIARALINNPEILLADEPTGALDSETSVQIMELIKEIAKERLVIMVTHNPDLAEKYSNRTIKLFDGELIGDSNPYETGEEKIVAAKKGRGESKTSMSFFTALSLSFNNLLTKKTRTFLTAFAGSIGIIGIALIMSLSSGSQAYIQRVQEDTLSQFPLIIETTTADIFSIMATMAELQGNRPDRGALFAVYSNNVMNNLMTAMSEGLEDNDLRAFRHHIEYNRGTMDALTNAITYTYDIHLNIFASDTSYGVHQVNPSDLFRGMGMGGPMGGGMMGGGMNIWTEMINNPELLALQYDVLAGRWPTQKNEVVLIVDENNEITDFALYTLGLMNPEEINAMMQAMQMGEEFTTEISRFTYDELLALTFKMVLSSDMFQVNNGLWVNTSDDEDFMVGVIENGLELQVVGIIRPSDEAVMTSLSGNIGYLYTLTEYIIQQVNASPVVAAQRASSDIDIFTGEEFNGDSTFERNLATLGAVDIEIPSTIRIYPRDFESKEAIEQFISDYNRMVLEAGGENTIHYTDFVGMMMASISTIINMISNVLIAFVAISLVVSSIMIGIITYVSVLERTKEIGILKSIGASKRDISRVFNAETLIVGFTAGALGVGVTALLTIPANIIIHHYTGVSGIAALPVLGAIVLVLLSMALTLVAGLIPSQIAARKDPVVALRTE